MHIVNENSTGSGKTANSTGLGKTANTSSCQNLYFLHMQNIDLEERSDGEPYVLVQKWLGIYM